MQITVASVLSRHGRALHTHTYWCLIELTLHTCSLSLTQMIHLAGHQFDMLDSVLARVEELLDNRT